MRCKSIVSVTVTVILGAATVCGAFAQSKYPFNGPVQGKFITENGVGMVPKDARTIPNWTSSFSYQGKTYPFTMVGTDPASTHVSTSVATVIIPLKFVFADGTSLDGGGAALANTLGSPNFQDATYSSSVTPTQFGDAVQRAEFYSTEQIGWHTLLATPTVLPTQVINVPSNQAIDFMFEGSESALMSYSWFSARLQNLLESLHIAPNTLPIFQTYNTFLYIKTLSNCCVLGYHGATSSLNGNGKQQVQTYIYAAWSDSKIFISPVNDILPLSHEISEWMNDPFINNIVPPWQFPFINAGCQGNLETGDPIEVFPDSSYPVTINGFTYHPQNEALLQWFSRESPSSAIDGAYSYPNESLLTGPSKPCQ